MKSDERHEREMHYRNRGFTQLGAREAVRRDDILRGARRCRDNAARHRQERDELRARLAALFAALDRCGHGCHLLADGG